MSFIAPDEFIIVYDDDLLTTDELSALREAGVRTAFERLYWADVETAPGVYDWSKTDATLERCAAADMKALVRVGDDAPQFLPDDWYIRDARGTLWRNHNGYGGDDWYTLVTPWNRQAQMAEREFLLKCIGRYAGPKVQLYAGGPHGGEVILPGMIPCYCDDHALADFRRYAEEQWNGDLDKFNQINNCAATSWTDVLPADLPTYESMQHASTTVNWLATSLLTWLRERHSMFPEIWLSLVERNTRFAEAFECGPRSGNWLARHVYATLPGEMGLPLNLAYFEVYRTYGTEGALANAEAVLGKTWIGSQFCDGLYVHTDDAIRSGIRGFLTGPIHRYNPYDQHRLGDWQTDAIRWSLKRWRTARLNGPSAQKESDS